MRTSHVDVDQVLSQENSSRIEHIIERHRSIQYSFEIDKYVYL